MLQERVSGSQGGSQYHLRRFKHHMSVSILLSHSFLLFGLFLWGLVMPNSSSKISIFNCKNPIFSHFSQKKMLSLVSQITTLYQAPPPAKNAKNLLLHRSFSKKVISQAPRPSPAPALQGAEFQLNLRWIAEEFSKKVSKFSVCASLGVFARLSASLRVFAHLCAFCNSSFYCDSRQTSRFRSVQ